jgi:putative membrane protein
VSLTTLLREENADRAARVVRDIERSTSAEVVVAVREAAAHHRDAHLLGGIACGVVVVTGLMVAPLSLPSWLVPLALVCAVMAGGSLVAAVPALERMLVGSARRGERVAVAARATFIELGISHTRGRTGVLVFAALRERAVEVLFDKGIDPRALPASFAAAQRRLEIAVGAADVEAFFAALQELGPSLAVAAPRRDDDENELPDRPSTPSAA